MAKGQKKQELQEAQELEKGFLNPREAAAVLGLKASTLGVWRSEGKGPVFYRFNRMILYKREDLMKWADEHYACVKPKN